MPVTAYIAVDSFTTVLNGERRWARRGRSYPGDDPLVIARPTLFRPVAAFNPDEAEDAPKPKRTYRRRKG
jgi:hypothetical protein